MSSTIYLLGAGASAASEFELPLMKGFFASPTFSEKYRSLYPYIRKYFNHFSTYDINVEELITHVEISLEKYKYSDFEIHTACQKDLLNYITERLQIPERTPCKYHGILFDKLDKANDSVLTLNYDCIFEQSIYNREGETVSPFSFLGRSLRLLGYSHYKIVDTEIFDRAEYQEGFYIKLHGSVDWLYCPNTICMKHQNFQVYPFWDEKRHRRQPGEPCDICGSPLQRVIVMPTMKKTFDNYPKLGFLWETAFKKLKESEKLVLIGTSLAVSDYYLTWLIREASVGKDNFKVEVVNRSKEPAIRAKELTATREIDWYKDFQTWVAGKGTCELV